MEVEAERETKVRYTKYKRKDGDRRRDI